MSIAQGNRKLGAARAGALGKKSYFLTVEGDFIGTSADGGGKREVLRRKGARERLRDEFTSVGTQRPLGNQN